MTAATGKLADTLSSGAESVRDEAGKTTRRARKQFKKAAKHAKKDLATSAKKARKAAKEDTGKIKADMMEAAHQAREQLQEDWESRKAAQQEDARPKSRKERKAAYKDLKKQATEQKKRRKEYEMSRSEAKAAAKELKAAAKATKKGQDAASGKGVKKRRWPLVLGLGAAAAGAAYAMRPKSEPPLSLVPPRADDGTASDAASSGGAQAPQQRNGQPDTQASTGKQS
ncbi:MAG: hypothetical protein GEV04_10905 [Actinophytocola sp.]|nr:hypothetical protein [Actinophytocola sp.]